MPIPIFLACLPQRLARNWQNFQHLFSKAIAFFATGICALMFFQTPTAHAAMYTSNYGTQLPNTSNCDDCFDGPIAFGSGHSFQFFGQTYSNLYVGSNGYVTFGAGKTGFSSVALNAETLAPMIAGMFTDLQTSTGSGSAVYVNNTTPGQLIISWVNAFDFGHVGGPTNTFQLVIRSDQYMASNPGVAGQQIGFFYASIGSGRTVSAGFGDGLSAANPGEYSAYNGSASGLVAVMSAVEPWKALGPGGVPVVPVSQTISFTNPGTQTFGTAPLTLNATGGASGNPILFASTTAGICTTSGANGTTLTLLSPGTCTITANQAGNAAYAAATQVTANITISKMPQAALVVPTSNVALTVGSNLTLSAMGGTGTGAITYSSNSANCTIAGTTLTAAAVGACIVTVTKAADTNYLVATTTINVTVGDLIAPATPIIPFDGSIANNVSNGSELFRIDNGGPTISAGLKGATVQATGTVGVSTVSVTSGNITIPCPFAATFCKVGQSTLTVLAGESVKFSADGKVTSIQLDPAVPNSSPDRLNGQTLINLIETTIQAKVPALGTETVRKADAWNALGLGFTMGKLSVAAQLPMQVNPTLPDSVSLLPNGMVQVVTNGVIVNLVPALLDTARFTSTLQDLNFLAEMRTSPDGNIVVSYDHAIYSLRPNLFLVDADTSLFTLDANSNIRFDNQRVHPATYNFEQFTSMLAGIDSAASVQVQLDGKLSVTIQGTTYTLTPDYEVLPNTTSPQAGFVIRGGKLVINYPFGFSQEFAVQ